MTKRTVPEFLCVSSGSVELLAAEDADGEREGPQRWRMVLYTGGIIDVGWGPVVVDLESMQLPEGHDMPALMLHDMTRFVGRSDRIEVGEELVVEGWLFEGDPCADEVCNKAQQGGRWQASMRAGVDWDAVDYVSEESSSFVNGREIGGPYDLLRATTLKEASFCPLGADPNTSAVMLAAPTRTIDRGKERPVAGEQKTAEEVLAAERQRVAKIHELYASKDAAFALHAVANGWDELEAKANYADQLEARLAEQKANADARLAELQASLAEERKRTAPRSPARGIGGATPPSKLEGADAITAWDEAVGEEVSRLRSEGVVPRSGLMGLADAPAELSASQAHEFREASLRRAAANTVARANTELHAAYLVAYNSGPRARARVRG